ncbi:hypothetical protein ACFE04_017895 [Oxalis oulophora]
MISINSTNISAALTFTLLLQLLLLFQHLFLASSSSSSSSSLSHHSHPPPPPPPPAVAAGAVLVSSMEEKIRLGSTPPSCHNKCNACHPCMAVQVPTTPGHDDRLQPNDHHQLSSKPSLFYDPTPSGNYKPLGWKCHCGNHFYNP